MRTKILLILILCNLLWIRDFTHGDVVDDERQFEFFRKVMSEVKKNYVDEVSTDQLVEDALRGMLNGLDTYSTYLDAKNNQVTQNELQGQFGGIGVSFLVKNGLTKVVQIYKDGPAFKAGLQLGDIITAIDNQNILNMNNHDILAKLQGEPETNVKIDVLRVSGAAGEKIEFMIKRQLINKMPVLAKLFAKNSILCLKIKLFNYQTANMVKTELLNHLKANPSLEGIILDLRDNAGGPLDQAVEVASLFMSNATVVTTQSRNPQFSHIYKTHGEDISKGLPIIAIINGDTASSSEILVGALQDHGRALVLGVKSLGKGSVQVILPLDNAGALKLTASRYYTPSGKCIEKRGITPDIFVPDVNLVERNKEQVEVQSIMQNTLVNNMTVSEQKDSQLLKAIETLKTMKFLQDKIQH